MDNRPQDIKLKTRQTVWLWIKHNWENNEGLSIILFAIGFLLASVAWMFALIFAIVSLGEGNYMISLVCWIAVALPFAIWGYFSHREFVQGLQSEPSDLLEIKE